MAWRRIGAKPLPEPMLTKMPYGVTTNLLLESLEMIRYLVRHFEYLRLVYDEENSANFTVNIVGADGIRRHSGGLAGFCIC